MTKILFYSNSLGDTIGWMGQAEKYARLTGEEVHVFCRFGDFFTGLPNLTLYPKDSTGLRPLADGFDRLGASLDHKYAKELYLGWPGEGQPGENDPQEGLIPRASKLLGFETVEEIKPTLKFKFKKLKLKRPIVSLGSLSTMQQKFWNHPHGWNKVISHLKSQRIDVVSLDKDPQWGAGYPCRDLPAFNPIPSRSVNKTGLSLRGVASYIQRSLFFMGLSSGLSWLAWALDKPVLMVVGHTHKGADFSTPYRVQNTNVCHGCFNKHSVAGHVSDWYWCPENKDFECTRQITPEMVIEKVNIILANES